MISMDKKSQTTQTYNQRAKALANKFDSIRPRISYLEEVFAVVGKENPKVIEIGCGNGRDAVEIVKRTSDYLGIDISEELIKLAQGKVPQGRFEVADVAAFKFPEALDIVIAFASLIHIDKEEFKLVLDRIYQALNLNGVVYLSLKQSDNYREVTEEDEFGIRTYYYYSMGDIKEIAGEFRVVKEEVEEIRGKKWLEIILQKIG